MGKQTGRTIYKWKSFGRSHVFVPEIRGGTSRAKAIKVAKKQWKRKNLVVKSARKFSWGHPDKPVPGYVVAGVLKKKR